jgi:hypothetical protein
MKDGKKSWRRDLVRKSLLEGSDGSTGEIRRSVEVLFEPGDVVELRAFRERTTVSGYFVDREELVNQAAQLDGQGFTVYVTLNPVEKALLARAKNKVKHYPKTTTSDADILWRRWLPLDLDPVRPADVSSTDKEKQAALRRAMEVRDYLREQGWPEPVVADSGNGAHLLYRVDLPNNRESLELTRGVLEALDFKFTDDAVNVDTGVHNASRIWKLYGTTARKGDDVEERSHRVSRFLQIPEEVK